MFCRTCGNQLRETQKFCPKCGTKTAAEPVSTPTEAKDSVEPPDKSVESKNQEGSTIVDDNAQILESEGGQPQDVLKSDTQTPSPSNEVQANDIQSVPIQPEEAPMSIGADESKSAESNSSEPIAPNDGPIANQVEEPMVVESPSQPFEEAPAVPQDVAINQVVEESKETPLPNGLVLFIRTKLLETGTLDQDAKADLLLRTRAAGISDERTEFQMASELEKFSKKSAPEEPNIPDEQQAETKPKRRLAGLLWTLGILGIVVLFIGLGYLFRVQVMDQLDSWGLRTTAAREKLNVEESQPEVASEPNSVDVTEDRDLAMEGEQVTSESSNELEDQQVVESQSKADTPSSQLETENRSPQSNSERTNTVPVQQSESYRSNEPQPNSKPRVYLSADKMPEYLGGNKGLQTYIEKNLLYPPEARRQNLSGTVYLKYVVNEQGGVEQVEIVRGVAPSLDEEAIRVIKSLPGYSPGYNEGKPVKVMQNTKVRFIL